MPSVISLSFLTQADVTQEVSIPSPFSVLTCIKMPLETTDHTIRFRSIVLKRHFTQKPCDSLSSAGHERTYGNTFYEVHAFNEVQPHL